MTIMFVLNNTLGILGRLEPPQPSPSIYALLPYINLMNFLQQFKMKTTKFKKLTILQKKS